MPSLSAYRRIQQIRVNIVAPNIWVPLILPIGSVDALIQNEDASASFRFSTDNTIPATAGAHVAAGGGVTFGGSATEAVTVYVAAGAPTVIIALFQLNP